MKTLNNILVVHRNETFTLEGNDWLKITDGTHSFTINASDGLNTATNEIVFTRDCKKTFCNVQKRFRFSAFR